MSRKYKITILTVVALTVLVVLLIPNMALFAPGEEETEPDDQFKPSADPYSAYSEAIEEGKPIVIEFYARW